jgi:hypothetical protein
LNKRSGIVHASTVVNGSEGNMHPSRVYVLRNHHAGYGEKSGKNQEKINEPISG